MTDDIPDDGATKDLIRQIREGSAEARTELMDRVYRRLRAIASVRVGQTGQDASSTITDLVHDAAVKMLDSAANYDSDEHFFRVASTTVHNLLIDRIRRRQVDRRAKQLLAGANDTTTRHEDTREHAESVAKAIDELATADKFSFEVMKLYMYIGATRQQIGSIMKCSDADVQRALRFAKAIVRRSLDEAVLTDDR
ncbi:MAG: sigma-70 family RNA polymerase sigma factor [Planctomycetota bacterium]